MSLDELLVACLSIDNAVRKQAEDAVKNLSKQPEIVPELLHRVQQAADPQIRQLAAVLLRKRIARHWLSLPAEARQSTQSVLLHSVAHEPIHAVRRAVADVVAVVAKQTVPKNQWPELLGTMQQWSQGTSADHREVALTLFSSLAETIAEFMSPSLPALMAIIGGGLTDAHHGVRHAGLRAVEQLTMLVDQEAHVAAFHSLVAKMLDCARAALSGGREDEALKVFQLLVDACEAPAPLLAPHVPAIIQLACETAAARQLDLETRDQAVQVIAILANNKPKQLTKQKALLKQVVATLCAMSCEPAPGGAEDERDPSVKTPRAIAGQAMDTLALCLPTQHVGPEILDFSRAALSSANADDRCGGLTALAVLSEGGAVWLRKRVDDVLPLVMNGLKDGNGHVRAGAAFALGQMAEFMAHEVVEHHAHVLPALLHVMANESDPDLQERSCYALDTFCEALEPHEIAPYVGQVMEQLVRVIARGAHVSHAGVQEVALSAIASTAAASGKDFAPHAQLVLPALSHFMAATANDLLPCRCRATEVMGVMMEHLAGLPSSPLAPLVPDVMQVSLAGWQLGFSELREYSHGLWASIAKGMNEAFAPFLAQVVPLAMQSLDQDEGELLLAGSDDEDDSNAEASESPEKRGAARGAKSDDDSDDEDGGAARQFHVRSGVLDEKCSALQALGLYAAHCGAAYLPHLEASMQWAIKLADEAWHEELQIQACEALPRLIKCTAACFPSGNAATSVTPQVHAALQAACPALVGLLSNPDVTVVCAALSAWKEMLSLLGGAALGPWLGQVSDMTAAVLMDKAPCCEYEQDDDDDDEDGGQGDAAEDLLAAAADLLPVVVGAVGADAYAPVFAQSHLPGLLHRLGGSQPEGVRGIALGALAEVAERMQGHMVPHLQRLVPVLIKELRAGDPINRQNAAFAVGVLVEGCGAQASSPYVPQLLQALHPLFSNKESAGTRDNAVGCVARMILCVPPEQPPIVPLEAVVPAICAALPPGEDWAEAGPSYRALCQLMLSGPETTARIAQHVPAMIRALAEGAASQDLPQAVKTVIRESIHKVRAAHGASIDQLLAALPAHQQQALA